MSNDRAVCRHYRASDMALHQCVKCGMYWATNASEHLRIIVRWCPVCVGNLPRLAEDPPNIHKVPPVDVRHEEILAEIRRAATEYVDEERDTMRRRRRTAS